MGVLDRSAKIGSLRRLQAYAGDWSIAPYPGASFMDLSSYGVTVYGALGTLLPPLTHQATPYAVADGAALHGIAVEPRAVTLRCAMADRTAAQVAALYALCTPDRVGDETTPFVLKYAGASLTVTLNLVLRSDPQVTADDALTLHFVAYDPYWYAASASTQSLGVRATIASTNYLLERSAAGVWGALGSGPGAAVNCLAYAPDGTLYAGLNAAPGLKAWDGASWTTPAGGVNGPVYALCFVGADLYVGGLFSAAGGLGAANVARLRSGVWHTMAGGVSGGAVRAMALLTGGGLAYVIVGGQFTGYLKSYNILGDSWGSYGTTNGAVWGLAALPNQGMAAVGAFTTISGVAAARVAKVDRFGGWSGYGAGIDSGTLTGVVLLPDGRVAAGGPDEFSSGGANIGSTFYWNGTIWIMVTADSYTPAAVDADGVLWASAAGAGPLTWNGGLTHYAAIGLAASGGGRAPIALAADGRVAVGTDSAGASDVPAVTSVIPGGSAACTPTFTIAGPGTLGEIVNLTSGDVIYFASGLTLVSGETLTLDLATGTATSNLRGPLLEIISPDSQFGTFRLLPGANALSVYGVPAGTLPTASVGYRARYWLLESADA